MRRLAACVSVLAMMGVASSGAYAQDERLPARVRKEGSLELVHTVSYEPLTLTELVKRSSFVVRALVLEPKTGLSEDEKRVVTDTDVQVLEVFRDSLGLKATPVISVRQSGGSMLVAGRQVSASESDFPLLELGQEYVLFLYKDPYSRRLSVTGGPQGVFEATSGELSHVSKAMPLWHTDGPTSVVIAKSEFVRVLQQAIAEIDK